MAGDRMEYAARDNDHRQILGNYRRWLITYCRSAVWR